MQSGSCISAFPILQCKIITLVVNKLVYSRKHLNLRSLFIKYFNGGEFVQINEEQRLGKVVYCLHFGTFLPHPQRLYAICPFHLNAGSVAIAAIPFLREAISTRSCSMPVHCSPYQEVCQRLAAAHCVQVAHLCQTVGCLCRTHSLLFNWYRQ